MTANTPVRQQYLDIKMEYPEAILLFRMGDFYETFDEDASVISGELNIVLTSREMGKDNRVPLAGIPYHSLQAYLAKLVRNGHKVAICEQIGDVPSKGLVERQVVRVVTPGTLIDETLLDAAENNYLVAIVIDNDEAGLACVDISTGEFTTTQVTGSEMLVELDRLEAAEVLLPQSYDYSRKLYDYTITVVPDEYFEYSSAEQSLKNHFGVTTLDAYGCRNLPLAIRACGSILSYLYRTQKQSVQRLQGLRTYHPGSFMVLDPQTRRNLELFRSVKTGDPSYSLLSTIDFTKTAMGSRLIKKWISQPLLNIEVLESRLDLVETFHREELIRHEIVDYLKDIPDLERLLNRIANRVTSIRDLISMAKGLKLIAEIVSLIRTIDGPTSYMIEDIMDGMQVVAVISDVFLDAPIADPVSGGYIRPGFCEDLDRLRNTLNDAKEYIANLERTERSRTGIKSLKVGYTRVFGYYIEISNANLTQVPSNYSRKQTLVGGERFITPELKEYEYVILNTQECIDVLEAGIFEKLCDTVLGMADKVRNNAEFAALVDVFSSLAHSAHSYGYVRPTLTNDGVIDIKAGRHPVVERILNKGSFVQNDTFLSKDESQVIVLTGPNMSGKSTYIRQVAIISLMAQMGSFVPADSATIGLVDRVFSRIGLHDDFSSGQSTFMVEMIETANILQNATDKSLLILDEVGRGTSTFDGLAIARASLEYIHNNPTLGCKTLFATHYHELVQLAELLPRVINLNVEVAESDGDVIFLHRIVPGGANRSYGVHVAQLAGMPQPVLDRAKHLLAELEKDGIVAKPQQQPLFAVTDPIIKRLSELDLNSMTPMEAMNKLHELQRQADNQ